MPGQVSHWRGSLRSPATTTSSAPRFDAGRSSCKSPSKSCRASASKAAALRTGDVDRELVVVRRQAARVRAEDLRVERADGKVRSEEHTSELQSRLHLVCRLLLEKKKNKKTTS